MGIKNIQTAGYNGARTVNKSCLFYVDLPFIFLLFTKKLRKDMSYYSYTKESAILKQKLYPCKQCQMDLMAYNGALE